MNKTDITSGGKEVQENLLDRLSLEDKLEVLRILNKGKVKPGFDRVASASPNLSVIILNKGKVKPGFDGE